MRTEDRIEKTLVIASNTLMVVFFTGVIGLFTMIGLHALGLIN